jgi:hypothetical protein
MGVKVVGAVPRWEQVVSAITCIANKVQLLVLGSSLRRFRHGSRDRARVMCERLSLINKTFARTSLIPIVLV